MKETDLAKAIDRAAKQRAAAILCKARDAVVRALAPYWRPDEAGREFIAADIRHMLTDLAASADLSRMPVHPSREIIDACRADIMSGLLSALPKLQELAAMAAPSEDECRE